MIIMIWEMQNKIVEVYRRRVDPRPPPILSVIATIPLWLAIHTSQWHLKVSPETAFHVLFVRKQALYHSRTILFSSRYIKKLYFKFSVVFYT